MKESEYTKKIRVSASVCFIGSWICYIFAFIFTVFFINKSGNAWSVSIFLALPGVSMLYFGARLLLFSTLNRPYYLALKYAIGATGLVFSLIWLIYYAKYCSVIPISPSYGNDYSRMIFFCGVGECLVGAFLYALGYDIKNKLELNKKL